MTGPIVARTRVELAGALAAGAARRAVVMTMGALHAGHLSLIERARQLADQVVVTIFVNPLQFGEGEDFDAYPRDLGADLAAMAGLGVDVVFAPSGAEMYPTGRPTVTIDPGALGRAWEGAIRPGHFSGMLTVVHKLACLSRADLAIFGQKDAQQLALVRRMVADLDLPVAIEAAPIVREADGLAMSSRNAYLAPGERRDAVALSRALAAASGVADDGGGPEHVFERAVRELNGAPGIELQYVSLVDPDSLAPLAVEPLTAGLVRLGRGVAPEAAPAPLAPGAVPTGGVALLHVAAKVGTTRLIDNALVTIG